MALTATTTLALPQAAHAATSQVTFTGTPTLSVGLLSCPSTPDVDHLDITAGTAVIFANRLGRTATLHAGSIVRTIADKASTTVHFNTVAAAVTVYMTPSCALDSGTHARMTIDVNAAPAGPTPTVDAGAPIQAAQIRGSGGGSQQISLNDGGSHVTIAGGQIPSQASTAAVAGAQAPVVITNNRDLIEMIVLFAALLAVAMMCCAWFLFRADRRSKGGHRPPGLARVHPIVRDNSVPQDQATQIWDMAERVGFRKGSESRRARS